jgi:hypothetical protein
VSAAPADVIGLAVLGRMVFEGVDVVPVWDRLMARTRAAPDDAGAVMDLATLLLLSGQGEAGLRVQAEALALQKLFRRPAADASALKLLAIVTPGDLMANTPLDFLLEAANIELICLYVVPGEAIPAPPEHDVAFLAIGESEANRAALDAIEPLLANWPRPVLNGKPANIRALTRDGVALAMAGACEVLAPAAMRLNRDELTAIAAGHCPPCAFPLLVRPIASHAGAGLAKLDDASALPAYLAEQAEDRFYVTPFVDYAGGDGLYRKQRIVLIEGRPFICHMAVSERWMVHYMNAGMTESAEKRAEEARFMADFDTDFAATHAAAFAELHERLGLDYIGIDCAETRDGRLLLFEADVAMIVHAMDPPDPFAYKKAPMHKLFGAFDAMLRTAADGATPLRSTAF